MDRAPPPGVLLDHAQDKVVVLDAEGRYTYANAAVARILGYDPSTLLGENAFEYVHEGDVEAVRAAFERTIDADGYTETTVEYRHRARDGSWVWLESRMSNVTDPELDGYVVSSRDVSDRVRAEQHRQETADRLEELAATAQDVLWTFTADWSELLFVNRAVEDVYGISPADLRADPRRFLDRIHPEDVPAVESAMARLSDGDDVEMEYRVNPDEDYDRWVWVQAHPIERDGSVVRITGFSRDVSDRRRRERQLYVMDNLLRHNLRNDLNVILGAADLVASEAPAVADEAAVIHRTGEDLLATAEKEREIIDLLTADAPPERVDLVAAVDRCLDVARERFPGATVEASLPGEAVVHTVGNLDRVLAELLDNAVRHGPEDAPTVRVSVSVDAESVRLAYEDDGPEIPPVERAVLQGGHEMTDVYHSSGLGLWLVYWAVELSDGAVDVERPPDGGNRITLTLPRADR